MVLAKVVPGANLTQCQPRITRFRKVPNCMNSQFGLESFVPNNEPESHPWIRFFFDLLGGLELLV